VLGCGTLLNRANVQMIDNHAPLHGMLDSANFARMFWLRLHVRHPSCKEPSHTTLTYLLRHLMLWRLLLNQPNIRVLSNFNIKLIGD